MAPIPSKVRPALVPLTLIAVAAAADGRAGAAVAADGMASAQPAAPSRVATVSGTRRAANRQILCIPDPSRPPKPSFYDWKRLIKLEPLRLFMAPERDRVKGSARVSPGGPSGQARRAVGPGARSAAGAPGSGRG